MCPSVCHLCFSSAVWGRLSHPELTSPNLPPPPLLTHTKLQYKNFKLIYRRYAGLYFCFGVDVTDNELLLMETIHLFVELLDQYFSNVCELDIVFHFNKVYAILDEYILAGEVQETSKRVILDRMKDMERLEG